MSFGLLDYVSLSIVLVIAYSIILACNCCLSSAGSQQGGWAQVQPCGGAVLTVSALAVEQATANLLLVLTTALDAFLLPLLSLPAVLCSCRWR
jgi:hypothetical protein